LAKVRVDWGGLRENGETSWGVGPMQGDKKTLRESWRGQIVRSKNWGRELI